jgi:hypothetical protein
MSAELANHFVMTQRIKTLEANANTFKESITSIVEGALSEIKNLKEIVTGQANEKTYSVMQVAKLLGISPAGVNDHIRKGNIKTKGNKGRYKEVTESELNRYIETKKK